MKRTLQGQYVTISTVGESARAFVPSNLPPVPPIDWSPQLRTTFDHALLALGRLDSATLLLPDVGLFLYTYIRKEAVLSSMIEGTQSSLSDLLMFEAEERPGTPLDDVREVSNYVAALEYGLVRLREGFPLSLRLLREMHGKLLSSGRGAQKEGSSPFSVGAPCAKCRGPAPRTPRDFSHCAAPQAGLGQGAAPPRGRCRRLAGMAPGAALGVHPCRALSSGRVGCILGRGRFARQPCKPSFFLDWPWAFKPPGK
jgi:Fic/DOC family N-terminal